MDEQKRLKFLRIAVSAGLIAGMVLSFELWFPVARTFPRAPLFFGIPDDLMVFFERLFGSLLFLAIIGTALFQGYRSLVVFAVLVLLILIVFDQMRLQPWVYQYLLLLVVIGLREPRDSSETGLEITLPLVQILIASLYIWSGIQKFSHSFSDEILPFLLDWMTNAFPGIQAWFFALGLGIAVTEALIGFGLLFRKTRVLAVCMAVLMHASIIILLVIRDYNSVVWAWNAALIAIVIPAFWKSDDSIGFGSYLGLGLRSKIAAFVVFASISLPLLSFAGLWDVYLSGALYSGRTEVGVIRVNEDLNGKLPDSAKKLVFELKSNGEKILPLFEWSMSDLNVPVYPEKRVFRQIGSAVCSLAVDKTDIELVLRSRPSILDGSFEVERIGCGASMDN